jgi:hypothetical protein
MVMEGQRIGRLVIQFENVGNSLSGALGITIAPEKQ